jgi:uncharacterized GH25 family protein
MTPCNNRRCQEALVTVTKEGKPLAGAVVILEPAEGQATVPLGAVTDANGTGWIVPRIPGRYTINVWTPDGERKQSQIVLEMYEFKKAGYEQGLARVTVEVRS